jgi:tRNA (guanine-N7-)-methyltransferase
MENNRIEMLTSEYRKLEIPSGRVELDLGCGKGSFTTALAELYPDTHVLAADIMIGRLRKLAKRAVRMELNNLEFLRVEAGMLVNCFLPPSSIDRLHILCPDPWPKKKHKGHRLLSSEFISRVAVILKKGGVFHFSTDDNPYFASATGVVERSGLFGECDMELIDDVKGIKTDFERLWEAEGKTVNHAAWKVL